MSHNTFSPWRRRILTSVAAAGVAAFASTSMAQAASVPAAGKSFAVRPQTINCTLTPSTPFEYYGGPYGGGEEGFTNVSCTASVYEIQIVVALFRNGVEVAYNTSTAYGTTGSGADVEYPLSAGTYVTEAQATVTASYGGTPVTSAVYASSSAYLP